MEQNNLLTVKNLHTAFRIDGNYYDAVDGVSFNVHPNEMLAIVGESGCGKSTIAMSVMGLHDMRFTRVSGEILLNGRDLLTLPEDEMNKIRGKDIGFIFQDPLASLNPLQRVGKQIEEALLYHTNLNEKERQERVLQLLNDVGIQNPKRTAQRFPHELSGGMRQRVLIATALSCNPSLIIADEPTTALDVTIQAQILVPCILIRVLCLNRFRRRIKTTICCTLLKVWCRRLKNSSIRAAVLPTVFRGFRPKNTKSLRSCTK